MKRGAAMSSWKMLKRSASWASLSPSTSTSAVFHASRQTASLASRHAGVALCRSAQCLRPGERRADRSRRCRARLRHTWSATNRPPCSTRSRRSIVGWPSTSHSATVSRPRPGRAHRPRRRALQAECAAATSHLECPWPACARAAVNALRVDRLLDQVASAAGRCSPRARSARCVSRTSAAPSRTLTSSCTAARCGSARLMKRSKCRSRTASPVRRRQRTVRARTPVRRSRLRR